MNSVSKTTAGSREDQISAMSTSPSDSTSSGRLDQKLIATAHHTEKVLRAVRERLDRAGAHVEALSATVRAEGAMIRSELQMPTSVAERLFRSDTGDIVKNVLADSRKWSTFVAAMMAHESDLWQSAVSRSWRENSYDLAMLTKEGAVLVQAKESYKSAYKWEQAWDDIKLEEARVRLACRLEAREWYSTVAWAAELNRSQLLVGETVYPLLGALMATDV